MNLKLFGVHRIPETTLSWSERYAQSAWTGIESELEKLRETLKTHRGEGDKDG